MVNNEILSFVKEQISQNKTKDEIRDMLVTHGGWDNKDVDEAFDTIEMSGKSMPGALEKIEAPAQKAIAPAPFTAPFQTVAPATTPAPASRPTAPVILEPSPEALAVHEAIIKAPTPSTGGVLTELQKEFAPSPAQRAPAYSTPTVQQPVSAPQSTEAMPKTIMPPVMPANISAQPHVSIPPSAQSPFQQEQVNPQSLNQPRTFSPTPAPAPRQAPMQAPAPTSASRLDIRTALKPTSAPAPKMNIAFTEERKNVQAPVMIGKPQGRKLLGFMMLLTGMIIGAVIMHAYLSGYFDVIVNWMSGQSGIPTV